MAVYSSCGSQQQNSLTLFVSLSYLRLKKESSNYGNSGLLIGRRADRLSLSTGFKGLADGHLRLAVQTVHTHVLGDVQSQSLNLRVFPSYLNVAFV